MLRRLDVRIPLFLSLILAVMVAVFGWRVSERQGQTYLQSVRERARILAQADANDAAHFLVISEFSGLEDHLLESAKVPDILGLQVFEPNGRMLCLIERKQPDAAPAIVPVHGAGPVPTEGGERVLLEGGRLVIWMPIEAGNRIGWLKMTHSLDPVREMQAVIWKNTALMGAFLVVAGTCLMLLVLRRPLRAIRELALFAHALNRRKGDRVAIPPVSFEIDELAESLNSASIELHSTEQQLIAEQERLAVTIRSIGDGVVACDRDGRVTLMNRVAEALTGWSTAEAFGRPFSDVFQLVDETTGAAVEAPIRSVIEGGQAMDLVGHALLVARDDSRRPIADSGAPILSLEGEILGVVIVFRDESARLEAEQKRTTLEEQLRQAQKMEAVGQMAGGIAHDFNNILTAIIGYSSLLLNRVEADHPHRDFAQRILKAADRAAGLTRSLLAFSRKQKVELKPEDLNEILRHLQHMLQRLIGEDIALRVELSGEPLIARVDAGQIEQVLLNLVTNARDAMPHGGLLSITTQAVSEPPVPQEASGLVQPSGPCAQICVSDSGAGMDAATLRRIFEPFFTTKPVGKGTGLGLAIVHGILQQHGATVRVYSHSGIGTTFKVYLPLLPEAQALALAAEDRPAPGGTERLLLVEDEPDVRQVVRVMLESGGYQIVEAADGAEALAILEREAGAFSLVVSDVIMPGMIGRDLRDRILRAHPGVRVLFLSGYTADVIQYKGFLEDEADLLMKPFSSTVLLGRIREVLDRPPAGGDLLP